VITEWAGLPLDRVLLSLRHRILVIDEVEDSLTAMRAVEDIIDGVLNVL
jgi:hypothetical protein